MERGASGGIAHSSTRSGPGRNHVSAGQDAGISIYSVPSGIHRDKRMKATRRPAEQRYRRQMRGETSDTPAQKPCGGRPTRVPERAERASPAKPPARGGRVVHQAPADQSRERRWRARRGQAQPVRSNYQGPHIGPRQGQGQRTSSRKQEPGRGPQRCQAQPERSSR